MDNNKRKVKEEKDRREEEPALRRWEEPGMEQVNKQEGEGRTSKGDKVDSNKRKEW